MKQIQIKNLSLQLLLDLKAQLASSFNQTLINIIILIRSYHFGSRLSRKFNGHLQLDVLQNCQSF